MGENFWSRFILINLTIHHALVSIQYCFSITPLYCLIYFMNFTARSNYSLAGRRARTVVITFCILLDRSTITFEISSKPIYFLPERYSEPGLFIDFIFKPKKYSLFTVVTSTIAHLVWWATMFFENSTYMTIRSYSLLRIFVLAIFLFHFWKARNS